MPAKHLRPNVKRAFILHGLNEYIEDHSILLIVLRKFMISPDFINTFFNFTDRPVAVAIKRPLIFGMTPASFDIKWGKIEQAGSVIDPQLLLAILKIAKIERLILQLDTRNKLDPDFVGYFLEVCRVLKEKEELRELQVSVGRSHLPFFLDALPQKITILTTGHISTAIQHLQKPIEQLKVGTMGKNFCYFTVLRAPARCINLTHASIFGELYDLHSHGPFGKNPILERLRLDVVFIVPASVREHVQMRADDWSEHCMSKFEQSFGYLKEINGSLCVEVRPRLHAKLTLQKCTDFERFHKRLIANVHDFIDLADRLQVKIELGRIDIRSSMNNTFATHAILKEMAEKLGMQFKYPEIFQQFRHNGCNFDLFYKVELCLFG